jgi:hypothetical protein
MQVSVIKNTLDAVWHAESLGFSALCRSMDKVRKSDDRDKSRQLPLCQPTRCMYMYVGLYNQGSTNVYLVHQSEQKIYKSHASPRLPAPLQLLYTSLLRVTWHTGQPSIYIYTTVPYILIYHILALYNTSTGVYSGGYKDIYLLECNTM